MTYEDKQNYRNIVRIQKSTLILTFTDYWSIKFKKNLSYKCVVKPEICNQKFLVL